MQDAKNAENGQAKGDRLMKTIHGREFNSSNSIYFLPSDPEEWERLNERVEVFVNAMGDINPCPKLVEAILSPAKDTGPKQVLDAGCGTGIWALEMASRFPHVQVKGMDMSPLPALSSRPPNFSFETQDLNDDLSRYYGFFDIIHLRSVIPGLKDVEKTFKELELCLKPGGLLIVINGDYFVREDKEQYIKMARLDGDNAGAVDVNGSWFNRMLGEILHSSVVSGKRQYSSYDVVDLGPWDHELCDPEWSASGSMYIPIGPWAEGSTQEATQRLQRAGKVAQDGFLRWNRTLHPVLLSYGLEQATLDNWSRNIDQELTDMKHKMWVRFCVFWTRRRQGDGLPAPPLPNHETRQSTAREVANSLRPPQSAMFEVYYSKEETIARMKKRKESIRDLPVFAVERAWKEKQKKE